MTLSRSGHLIGVRKQLACGPGVSLQNAAAAVRFASVGTPIPTLSQASAAFSGIRWNSRVYGPRRELLPPANQVHITVMRRPSSSCRSERRQHSFAIDAGS